MSVIVSQPVFAGSTLTFTVAQSPVDFASGVVKASTDGGVTFPFTLTLAGSLGVYTASGVSLFTPGQTVTFYADITKASSGHDISATSSYAIPAQFTTRDQVRAWLGVDVTDTTQNAIIDQLIPEVTALFLHYIGTDCLTVASYTETYNGLGTPTLTLRHRPIQSVSALSVDGKSVQMASSPTAPGFLWDDPTVYLTPYTVSGLGYLNRFPRAPRCVTVTYSAGYLVVPQDVAMVTTEFVALKMKERGRIGEKSKTLGPSQTVSMVSTADGLPLGVRVVLDRYKRTSWA